MGRAGNRHQWESLDACQPFLQTRNGHCRDQRSQMSLIGINQREVPSWPPLKDGSSHIADDPIGLWRRILRDCLSDRAEVSSRNESQRDIVPFKPA